MAHKESNMAERLNWTSKAHNSTWTVNFQLFNMDLEKAEEPEIKLPTLDGSLKKQESSRKTSTGVTKSQTRLSNWTELIHAEDENLIIWSPDWRTASLEKMLMLGKIEGRKRRGQQRMRCVDGIMDSMDMSLSKPPENWWWTVKPGMLKSKGSQSLTQPSDWAELKHINVSLKK